MKVLLISDADVESGRGPVTRLAHVLPELARRADVVLAALGEPDPQCRAALDASGVVWHRLPFALKGWKVRDLGRVVHEVERTVRLERPDLVVLYREIWDLMRALPPALAPLGVPFLVMPHSVPFLDALARPSHSFVRDLGRHLLTERRPHALRYLLTHVHQVGLMRTLPRVVINETVASYLDGYFPKAVSVTAFPGYAVNVGHTGSPRAGDKNYDLAFMAKLTPGKGVFDALDVMRDLRRTRPGTRMLVIGSFENDRIERKFLAMRRKYGLDDAVQLAGWLTGADKYRALGTARVFCYPSISADTFSLCLLEALACGLPAVCYDVPFARAIYGSTASVRRVPFRSRAAMADALQALLSEEELPRASTDAQRFAARYASWSAVADAEIAAYLTYLGTKATDSQTTREYR